MTKVFRLEGLGCADCAAKIERGIARVRGVTGASVNLITQKLFIEYDPSLAPDIAEHAARIVRKHEPDVKVTAL
ncbi:MAG: heavy-metal-associated domain-containing protein [Clostridiales bacterium]|nr:heavy-metal-associated domain-containing protein [Clostridiales bacterium]